MTRRNGDGRKMSTREDDKSQTIEKTVADVESGDGGDVSLAAATPAAPTSATPAAAAPAAANNAKKNAKKPRFPCGKCEKETMGTMSVACQTCEYWFHYECINGMNREYFDNCKLSYDLHGYSAFLCQVCRKVVAKFNKTVKQLEEKVDDLTKRLLGLEREKEDLGRRVEKMEAKTSKVEESLVGVEKEVVSGMEKAKEEVKRDMTKEMAEREERSANVVFYGVAESQEEDAEKRSMEEKEKVEEVVRKIGVEIRGEVEVKFRAGRKSEEPDAKPRPLIVKITDDEKREKIFRDARVLSRIPEYRRVFVSQDLTWAQREEVRKVERELREEADKKTKEAVESGKKGKFILVGQRGRRRMVWTDREG